MNKDKNRLARNRDKASDMYIHGRLFEGASIIKIQLSMLA